MPRVVVHSSFSEENPSLDPKLWILAIGVEQYQDANLPALRYATADCQGVVEALAAATRQLWQTEFFVHHALSERKPVLEVIQASLQQIVSAARAQDIILFYFSGHGLVAAEARQPFLCLVDTNSHNLSKTGLSLQDLLQQLSTSTAQKQFLLLDACHSGSLTLRNTSLFPPLGSLQDSPATQLVKVLNQHARQSQGFYALLSCDKEQYSWELPDIGHGVFTYYLIQGLRGEAADKRGNIKVDELYFYIYSETLKHIDRLNQQLELLNQQQRSLGITDLLPSYPLQTPKRIVEGVGEWAIGCISNTVDRGNHRQALVVDGFADNQTSLAISRILRGTGGFELEYWLQPKKTWQDARTAIQTWFETQIAAVSTQPSRGANRQTLLLYLRGVIQETPEGEAWLVLGDSIRYSCSWLRQKLRQLSGYQQIVVLDCPGASSLKDWLEDLRLEPDKSQCLIAAAAPLENPELFAQKLLNALESVPQNNGLPVAGWIFKLQQELAGTSLTLHPWLSGGQGIIEVIPEKIALVDGAELKLCPYMGLTAFSEADAPYFFGREQLTQALINALNQQAFLAVVGASGSGKSSLVQAGLMAQLRQGKQLPGSDRWWMGCFRPGSQPINALIQCLLDSHIEATVAAQQLQQLEEFLQLGVEGFVRWLRTRTEPMVVLAIDQFEELFTLASERERQRLLDILLGALHYAGDRFKVIITIRADFIAACLEVPALVPKLQQSTILVPPQLAPDDYERAIVQPAAKVGLKVEPELVATLRQELQQTASGLPILQFVLEQLWERRQVGVLTLRSYQQEIGGIRGALERKAKFVYESLSPEEQDCAQWIFVSLAQLGEGTEDTRRRVRKADLIVPKYSAPLVERTLQALIGAKLVVVNTVDSAAQQQESAPGAISSGGEITVEIAHEVLIRYWSTLRQWLEEKRDRLRLQRQIEQAAQQWQQNDKHPDYLLRGTRLEEAEEIYQNWSSEFSPVSYEFIQASAIARAEQLKQERLAREDGVRAANQIAESHLSSNRQLEALVNSVKGGQRLRQIPDAPDRLKIETLQTLQYICSNIQELNRLEAHGDAVSCVSYSPDGNAIASGGLDANIHLWQPDGTLVNTFIGHTNFITDLTFSSDSQMVISASRDTTVRLWNLDGTLIDLFTHASIVRSISLSPDGQLLAVAEENGYLTLRQLDGTTIFSLSAHAGRIFCVTFNRDGQLLASAGEDRLIKIWQLDGTLLTTIVAHDDPVTSVSFSSDSQLIASGSADRTIKLWQLNGTLIEAWEAHNNRVACVIFTPDGESLVSSSFDFTIKHWGLDGNLLSTIQGHTEAVSKIVFSPNGEILASAGADRKVKLWRWRNELQTVLRGHRGYVNNVNFSPDGNLLASAGLERAIKLWSVEGKLIKSIDAHDDQIVTVNFSPNGQLLASASFDRTLKLWQVSDGTLLRVFEGHKHTVYGATFSPDGKTIASASADGTVKLWDLDGNLLRDLPHQSGEVICVVFSPDGQRIISGNGDGKISFWQSNGTLVDTIPGHTTTILALSISPNGKILASASNDRTVKFWGIDTSESIGELPELDGPAYSISFSPDSNFIAIATSSKIIQIWDINGNLQQSLVGSTSQCLAVKFNSSRNLLAVADAEGIVRLIPWNLSLDELLDFGCNWLQDYLKTNPHVRGEENTGY